MMINEGPTTLGGQTSEDEMTLDRGGYAGPSRPDRDLCCGAGSTLARHG
jgi:hypothetical protein